MKRTASECSDNDVFFDDGDMLKDGLVIRMYITVQTKHLALRAQLVILI